MPTVNRVLDPHPIRSLREYRDLGGGDGVDAARRVEPTAIVEEVAASGLRGRGGAGFPTGTKWRSIVDATTAGTPPVVVVNAAEGEPGSFKDRTLLRTDPYRPLEGALIAAAATGAREVVVGLKQSFLPERRRVCLAIAEMRDAGWLDDLGVDVRVVLGPGDYLYGEETALLEVIEGRQPFPRIAPPYRRGLDGDDEPTDPDRTGDRLPPISLVLANNVETFANVPGIVVRGADWFRSLGTDESPGTIVCTVSGDVRRAGVAEFPLGTPLAEIIETVGGGAHDGQELRAAISGVSNGIVPASAFDTPASYEAMKEIGSGLGASGFIVIDDSTDPVALALGISRFLAVESCGQCEPCKSDGLEVADALRELLTATGGSSGSTSSPGDRLRSHLETIADGARCYLATQHHDVVTSVLESFADTVRAHADGAAPAAEPVLVAPIVDIDDGAAALETAQATKQPDWTHAAEDSGRWPAAYLGDTPVEVRLRRETPSAAVRGPATGEGASDTVTPRDEAAPVDVAGDVPVDVAVQLDLAHHDLVEALLRTRSSGPGDRDMEIERFTGLLRDHVEVTTKVLFPWARRVGGDTGERIADRAEDIEAAVASIVDDVGDEPSERRLRELADDLHRLVIDIEREVLPLLEEHLGDADLDEIGRAMHEARLRRPASA